MLSLAHSVLFYFFAWMLTTLTFEFLGWSLQQNGKVFVKLRNLVTTLAWWLTCCESLVSRKSSELPCDMQ
jgi:hypothetical protein